MYRTVLDNTFAAQSTPNSKFNLMANSTFKRLHPTELASATAVLDYEFVDPLKLNTGYVNFYMDSIKTPFNVKIEYRDQISVMRPYTYTSPVINCFPGQDNYSISNNTWGLRKIDGMKISFTAVDPNYRGSMGLVEEIVFNDIAPVPEPFSMITLGGGFLCYLRKRSKK